MQVIFTRHTLTAAQVANIDPRTAVDCSDLARINITSMASAEEVTDQLLQRITSMRHTETVNCYGVLPAPIRALLHQREIPRWNTGYGWFFNIYEAFNVSRSVEGEKPTSSFQGWLLTQTFEFNF